MPREVSKVWLWTSQNAFLTGNDPSTGTAWADRQGKVFGKGFVKSGNIEPYLSYKKLHRTGRLLRSLKTKHNSNFVMLYSNAPYASEHELGQQSGKAVIKDRFVTGGAKGVAVGGKLHARPFMKPSKQVLRAPYRLIVERMKRYGWQQI